MWAETHTRAKQQQLSWKIPIFHLLPMRADLAIINALVLESPPDLLCVLGLQDCIGYRQNCTGNTRTGYYQSGIHRLPSELHQLPCE